MLINIAFVICLFHTTFSLEFELLTRQCQNETNCKSDRKSILIAIDGSGSRKNFGFKHKFLSQIGVNHNEQWIWTSHVANFWEDYEGDESHYFHGPDASEMIIASNEVDAIRKEAHQRVCSFVKDHLFHNDYNIDIIGFSRGGFGAMELAHRLNVEGCFNFKPIRIRWMGLYDPVERQIDAMDILDKYNNHEIASNVEHVLIAERSRELGSRKIFGYAVKAGHHDEDKKVFEASHGGIGGAPGYGDCKEVKYKSDYVNGKATSSLLCAKYYTYALDRKGSKDCEVSMRESALRSGVPVKGLMDSTMYFGDFELTEPDHSCRAYSL